MLAQVPPSLEADAAGARAGSSQVPPVLLLMIRNTPRIHGWIRQ